MAKSTCLGESALRVQERKQIETMSAPEQKTKDQGCYEGMQG